MKKSNKNRSILCLLLALVMLFGVWPTTGITFAEGEESGDINVDKKIHMPVLEPPVEGDTQIIGYAEPNVHIILTVGSERYEKNVLENGTFTVDVPALEGKATVTAKATKDGAESKVTTHVVADYIEIKGKIKNTYTWSLSGITNGGLHEENGKKYFLLGMDVQAATEPYLAYLDAHMYYLVDERFASYIEKVEVQGRSSILYRWTELKPIEKDEKELPGVDGVYSSFLASSKGGWVRPTGADHKQGRIRFYLKDDTPQELIYEGMDVKTWAKEGNRIYEEFFLSQKLYDHNIILNARGTIL